MPESRGICRLEQHLPGSGGMLHVEKADLDDDILRMQMTMGYFKQPAVGREEESRWRVPTPSRYIRRGLSCSPAGAHCYYAHIAGRI